MIFQDTHNNENVTSTGDEVEATANTTKVCCLFVIEGNTKF